MEKVLIAWNKEPLPQVEDKGLGVNCVVPVRVGPMVFKLTVDTGAARSIIRKSVAESLMKAKTTKEYVGPLGRLPYAVVFQGLTAAMESEPASTQVPVLLGLTAMDGETQRVQATGHDKRSSSTKETTREPKKVELTTEFLVVDGASDPFLIGFGDMCRMGSSPRNRCLRDLGPLQKVRSAPVGGARPDGR